jgi:hypothetical protein
MFSLKPKPQKFDTANQKPVFLYLSSDWLDFQNNKN